MRRNQLVALLSIAFGVATVSAHIMVSPPQSKAGGTQRYEVRVHNEAKVAVTAIDLEIPAGLTVTDIVKPSAGTFAAKKTGDRITEVTWQIEVAPSKYVALPFTATNPGRAGELHWNIREHLADGSTVDWSDKPGAKEKASVTRLSARLLQPSRSSEASRAGGTHGSSTDFRG